MRFVDHTGKTVTNPRLHAKLEKIYKANPKARILLVKGVRGHFKRKRD